MIEAVDLAQVGQAVAAEFRRPAAAKGITVRFSRPPSSEESLLVAAGPDHLLQLVRNLVENAVKYTPPGGQVTVTCTAAEGQAFLMVQDTGLGIAPEDLPYVFDRFWRADKSRASEGSGLGLAICADIAHTYGGILEAQSVLGQGS